MCPVVVVISLHHPQTSSNTDEKVITHNALARHARTREFSSFCDFPLRNKRNENALRKNTSTLGSACCTTDLMTGGDWTLFTQLCQPHVRLAGCVCVCSCVLCCVASSLSALNIACALSSQYDDDGTTTPHVAGVAGRCMRWVGWAISPSFRHPPHVVV